MRTPIAVFAYNRPRHLRQLFESLMRCERLNECEVHIFCDGPKKPEHVAYVQAARQVVDEFAPQLHASVIKREQNLGLGCSIVSGVSELCKQAGRIIVLEDDLILHPFFVNFMLQALDHYTNDQDVAQVAGFTFPILTHPKPDAFFLPITTSWGWATWWRAWNLFEWDIEFALSELDSDPLLRFRFDLEGSYPYGDILRSAVEGKVDSWAIRWYWSVFSTGKLVLYPRHSLVWQNGFDESATHTRFAQPSFQTSRKTLYQLELNDVVIFPATVRCDNIILDRLKKHLRQSNHFSLAHRVCQTVKHTFNKLINLMCKF